MMPFSFALRSSLFYIECSEIDRINGEQVIIMIFIAAVLTIKKAAYRFIKNFIW